ncbi:MAG: MoaD/ThiS family protein [Treponema sp.]|jgi:molybdopterin converting factor small subunit|nr:MoaD/ThiS family protein [Treponema sp.]
MAVTIQIPTALRGFTDRQGEVKVEGATVGLAVTALAAAYPAIKPHLFQEDGSLRSFINVFVGEINIKKLQGLDTPLTDGAVIMLVPAIAGGASKLAGGTCGSTLEFVEQTPRVFGR